MDTKQYINTLKNKSRQISFVANRQVLCHYLYKNGVSPKIISEVLGYSERLVYKHVYKVRDLLEVNDKTIATAYEELNNHNLYVKPCTVSGSILSMHAGHKLLIDNFIY